MTRKRKEPKWIDIDISEVEELKAPPNSWSKWFVPSRVWTLYCCDCGLSHDLETRINDDGALEMRVKRLEGKTKKMRKQMKVKVKKDDRA